MSNDSNGALGNDRQLENNLNQLKEIAKIVHTDAHDGKKMLENYGYNWFDKISEDQSDDVLKEEVKRAFYVAVNDVIYMKVEPVKQSENETTMELNEELLSLLELGIDDKKHVSHYFSNHNRIESAPLTSPQDLAKYLSPNQDHVPPLLVKNLIQYQFRIRWSTPFEEPAKYTFYDFCGRPNTTKYFLYQLRQAHVKATLYQECCRKPERPRKTLYDLLGEHKKNFCPEVYIKTDEGWKIWEALEDKFSEACIPSTKTGINQHIQKFFDDHADIQKSDDTNLRKSLTHSTIYFAVIKDTDFKLNADNKLGLNEIRENQVYVGRAKNGIRGRWMNDGGSHCEKMEECLHNVWAMTTYDPLRLKKIQLVDARLALAKVRGEKTALFVIRTFADLERAKNAIPEIERSLGKAFDMSNLKDALPSGVSESDNQAEVGSTFSDQTYVAKREEQPQKANYENCDMNDLLKMAENLYQGGTKEVTAGWKPTDMRYGMNYDKNSRIK